ncbi:unnamed protein product [Symbiodinium sp. CCMP2592]|nr:unnamed protein product [Symbiodinium sp. CCMP2592]
MGNTCCLGREKPPAPPAARAESEARKGFAAVRWAVVLLRRRAQQSQKPWQLAAKDEACGHQAKTAQDGLDSKVDASAVCHGKTGQRDRAVGPVARGPEEAVKEEITQEALDKAFDTKVRLAETSESGLPAASSNGPNQDNFCLSVFKNGYTFACVLDGHGKKGHLAATRAAQLIPFLLLEQGIGDERVAEAAIEKAVAALWKGSSVWVANAGDSRCVLLEDNQVVFATSDHKPSWAEEKARVEGSGGEVRVEEQVPRVYAAGQRGPGLGVTRALGDVHYLRLDTSKQATHNACRGAKAVLASDGSIWEVVGQKDLPSLVLDGAEGSGQLDAGCLVACRSQTETLVQGLARWATPAVWGERSRRRHQRREQRARQEMALQLCGGRAHAPQPLQAVVLLRRRAQQSQKPWQTLLVLACGWEQARACKLLQCRGWPQRMRLVATRRRLLKTGQWKQWPGTQLCTRHEKLERHFFLSEGEASAEALATFLVCCFLLGASAKAALRLDSKVDASAVCHGKTGQRDRAVGPVARGPEACAAASGGVRYFCLREEAVKEEITQEALDKAFDTKVRLAETSESGLPAASSNGPNQDNFCLSVFKNGYTFACVLDGHGKKGHLAATRAAQLIPFLLLEQGIGDERVAEAAIEKALIQAFEKAKLRSCCLFWHLRGNRLLQADADLSRHADSGCTAVAALWKGSSVWIANAGDSRCVLLEDNQVVFATSDHKPSWAEEKARVEGSGGEVRVEEQVPRVYAAGQRGPGLGVTRALGDAAAKCCGIIATPQVHYLRLDTSKQAKAVLASDGIWEVVGQKDLPSLVLDGADTAKLQSAAFEGWASLTGGGYRDDVTSIVIPLGC